MEPLQLFTLFLLALAGTHLVFRTASLLSRWRAKGHRSSGIAAREQRAADHSSWYVFFDPEDLYGRRSSAAPDRERRRKTEPQRPRPAAPRMRQTV